MHDNPQLINRTPTALRQGVEILRGAAVQAARDSNIAREIAEGKKLGVELHDLIDRLGQRVEPVRMVVPQPTASVDNPGAPPAATDLAREVQALNGTVAEGIRRLSILIDSIDL